MFTYSAIFTRNQFFFNITKNTLRKITITKYAQFDVTESRPHLAVTSLLGPSYLLYASVNFLFLSNLDSSFPPYMFSKSPAVVDCVCLFVFSLVISI